MYERVGPTHDEGQLLSRGDVGDNGPGEMAELSWGELSVDRVELAHQMVGDAASLVRRDFVGGDVEAFVDLHFVGVDNLGLEAGGELDGEPGFSSSGGAQYDDDLLLLALSTSGGNRLISGGGVHSRPAGSERF
ncbi:hypothetical protein F2P56_012723 [Juglans regia]|uniref:Uncharacterized protein n=1 Tax=Juglans regia TaxID=51240 RepID=A0A834CUU3_JUGRE|nr:hypothetical protein F2P56_012723 [Juglans regia]